MDVFGGKGIPKSFLLRATQRGWKSIQKNHWIQRPTFSHPSSSLRAVVGAAVVQASTRAGWRHKSYISVCTNVSYPRKGVVIVYGGKHTHCIQWSQAHLSQSHLFFFFLCDAVFCIFISTNHLILNSIFIWHSYWWGFKLTIIFTALLASAVFLDKNK